MDFSNLPNIGPVVSDQLNQAGIHDVETLKELGAEQAWLRIRAFDESACIHRLYGIEGAIQGIPKKQLSPERKKELKDFYQWRITNE